MGETVGSERLRLVWPPLDWAGILGGQVENSRGAGLTSPGGGRVSSLQGYPLREGLNSDMPWDFTVRCSRCPRALPGRDGY